jgi:ubiquinone/menaquinone biosynthesis C-methylase UbiE
MENNEYIKEHVKKRYAEVAINAQQASGGCGCGPANCCGPSSLAGVNNLYVKSIGYSDDEVVDLPVDTAAAAAGCGNPTAIAKLKPGEVVLDLGSGGGIDVFLAAKKVGPNGRVIGVDMTNEMLNLAKKGAEELELDNVEFRKGDIEDLPIEDDSVDVIISNCVINLAPDKDKVFRESYRVLKSGGRITVSDIVTDGPLPQEIKENPDKWAACVSGALDVNEYMEKIRNAGFKDVEVLSKRSSGIISSAEIQAFKP